MAETKNEQQPKFLILTCTKPWHRTIPADKENRQAQSERGRNQSRQCGKAGMEQNGGYSSHIGDWWKTGFFKGKERKDLTKQIQQTEKEISDHAGVKSSDFAVIIHVHILLRQYRCCLQLRLCTSGSVSVNCLKQEIYAGKLTGLPLKTGCSLSREKSGHFHKNIVT